MKKYCAIIAFTYTFLACHIIFTSLKVRMVILNNNVHRNIWSDLLTGVIFSYPFYMLLPLQTGSKDIVLHNSIPATVQPAPTTEAERPLSTPCQTLSMRGHKSSQMYV